MSSNVFGSGSFRSHNSGTLQGVVVLLLLLGGVAIFVLQCGANFGRNRSVAEGELDTWAKELGVAIDVGDDGHRKRVCNDSDNDGDGYVSCSYTEKGVRTQVECSRAYTLGSGCRDPKVHVPAATVHVGASSKE